jgi:hypothetical protein
MDVLDDLGKSNRAIRVNVSFLRATTEQYRRCPWFYSCVAVATHRVRTSEFFDGCNFHG